MITIIEEITISAGPQKVWGFLSDFEVSLSVNSFHKEIIIPHKFSLTGAHPKFNIIHNFGLGNVNMLVEIIDYTPLKLIKLFKKNNGNSYAGFEHSSKYELVTSEDLTTLKYTTIGSFNFKIQNIPFKPILTNVIKTELLNIKKMVESSDEIPDQIETKITTT